ncbi:hypothetical protein [Enterovirga sp. CN4-39]|uniref:hypothetical protein n=1 Tax=Enterovirga sp. CN4-39 TaxID=3400910 RepID=UPI003BFC8CAC
MRGLVVEEGLSYREAAARSGLREGLVGEWARRLGWRRGERGGGFEMPPPPPGRARESPSPGGGGNGAAPFASPPPQGEANQAKPGGGGARGTRPGRYPPELREAAGRMVEGSRAGMEWIAAVLGISVGTLHRWRKAAGWRRPDPPDKGGLHYYRSRRWGRPYGGDAVGIARDLVTGSILPLRRIAAQAGISKATLCRWIVQRGWTRHPAVRNKGRRGPYGPAVMAAARDLYRQTELPVRNIAARVGASPGRVWHWAKAGGWTRPRDQEDPYGRIRRKRPRRRPPGAKPPVPAPSVRIVPLSVWPIP